MAPMQRPLLGCYSVGLDMVVMFIETMSIAHVCWFIVCSAQSMGKLD